MGKFNLLKDLSTTDIVASSSSDRSNIIHESSKDSHRIYTVEYDGKTLKVGVPVVNEAEFDAAITVDNPKIDEILKKFDAVILEETL